MDIRRRVGLNLQRLRHEKEWSQEKLNFESGVHRTYISGIERGVRNPTLTNLHKLAKALEVPLGALVDPPPRKRSTN